MDLLQTVRKEGSRGGRSEFSWSEVQGSAHRENYLGHSLMAPVGRWQKGRDLNWYAKGNDGEELTEEQKREVDAQRKKDEIRKIKEREEDEMRKALGLEPIERGDGNANLMPLGARDDKELQKVIKETTRPDEEEEEAGGKGLGFGGFEGRAGDEKEVLKGKEGPQLPAGLDKRRRSRSRSREHRRRRHDEDRPRRRRSRSRDREDREREHRRHRSRSRDHHHSRRDEQKRAYHDDNRNRDRDRDHRPRRDDNYRPNRDERKDERRERPRSLERRRPRTRSPGERRDRDRRR